MPTRLPSINLQQIALAEAVQFFRDLTGANFHVNWRALETLGVSQETPVTLKLTAVSIRTALDLLTEQLTDNLDKFQRVYWVVDDGVILISTGTALNSRVRTRSFYLGALLMTPVKVTPSRLGMATDSNRSGSGSSSSSGGGRSGSRSGSGSRGGGRSGGSFGGFGGSDSGDGGSQIGLEESREERAESLMAIVRNAIGEEMWQPGGPGSLRIVGNRLFVSQTRLGFKLLEQSLGSR